MLTNTKIKNSRPKNKLYRLSDSNGLAIEITPSGEKHWRYRYRFNGKASMISLGKYEKISLKQARNLRDDYRELLDKGQNPSEYKVRRRFEQQLEIDRKINFGTLFDKWYVHNKDNWSDKHAQKVLSQCQRHLLKQLKSRTIDDISAQDILWVFKKIEAQGVIETLEKVRGYTARVFRYGVGLGLLSSDPTRDLPQDIFKKKIVKNFAHVTNPKEIGKVLNKIDTFTGSLQVGIALRIAPHIFLRPAELAGLEWDEINFEGRQIKIPKERMKMSSAHIIPLSPQVLNMLEQMHEYSGSGRCVFPGVKGSNRGITPDSIRMSMRRVGIDKNTLTTHGFRHTASTLLHEQGFNSDAIERQLSHREKNKIKGTYNHAEHLNERRDMMDRWSDYLDNLKQDQI
jgi:integrase